MTKEHSADRKSAVASPSAAALGPIANAQSDLPDRWCFGLSHPYIQRLIFIAGELEREAVPVR